MKVISVFKDAPAKMIKRRDGDILAALIEFGYLRYNRRKTSIRITEKGAETLRQIGEQAKTEQHPISEGKKLERRLQSTEVALFIHSLGISVYAETHLKEVTEPEYLPAVTLRRKQSANILGLSKFYGFLYTKVATYVMYNVADSAKTFYPESDEAVFNREIIRAGNPIRVIYLADRQLTDMAQLLIVARESPAKITPGAASLSADYYQAVEHFTAPVSFVTADDTGLKQMQIMLTENYKEKLVKYMLEEGYVTPSVDFIDAYFKTAEKGKTAHFLVFIDFDVKRLEKALNEADNLHILILKGQTAALQMLLGERQAKIFLLTDEDAAEILDLPPPEKKQLRQYSDEKGDGIIAIKKYFRKAEE